MLPALFAPSAGSCPALYSRAVHGGSSTLAYGNLYTRRGRLAARLSDSVASIIMRYRLMLAGFGTRGGNRHGHGRRRGSKCLGKTQLFLYCALFPLCLLALFL